MKHLTHIFLMLLTMLLLLSCRQSQDAPTRYRAFEDLFDHSKPIAFGEDEDIYVFCGQQIRSKLEPVIMASLEREVALVYNEKYFRVIFSDVKEMERLQRFKNLLFIGTIEEGDPVSRYLQQALDPKLQARVRQTTGEIFQSKNRFVKDQLILQVIGLDNERITDLFTLSANRIFDLFLDRYTKRLAYQTYQINVIEPDFFEPYPFSLKIPNNYQLYANDKNNRFLSFLYRARIQNGKHPDKFLSVYYEPMEQNVLDEKWLIDKRTDIGKVQFGDSLNVQTLRTESFTFAGHQGFRLSGAWINLEKFAGGAFQSYAFWDEKTKQAFLVDTMTFFPEGDKLPVLMELFMIASTLKVK
ncbi:MAG TPA: DUF4837 family protein [Candidatus Cloacimonadota bacterium]|nr:DUF4837 family protein [Candidatus Cloacimonadota bacterium]